MSGLELAVACVVVAAGAAVQGGVGFGMNLVAAPLLALIDPDLVPGPAIAVAAGVFLAVVLNIGRPRLRQTPTTLLVAGVVSAFGSTTSSIGGPPMAVVFANEPGPVVRANLSMIFVIGGLMSIVGLALVGDFGAKEAWASLLLLVPGGVGFLASKRIAAHLDAGRTRAGVLTVSLAGAVLVVVKELL